MLFVVVRHLEGQLDVSVASAAVRAVLAALGFAAPQAKRLSGLARVVAHAALLPVLAGVLAALETAGGFSVTDGAGKGEKARGGEQPVKLASGRSCQARLGLQRASIEKKTSYGTA